jgi:Cu+-exporting ATPase
VDGGLPGWIRLANPERIGMDAAIRALAARYDVWLLSGDSASEWSRWTGAFGSHMRFRQSPEDKLTTVRERQADGRRVLMIGDGLNDAGALAAADVGMAVSDDTACLVPACDAVIRGDRLAHLPAFLSYARRARQVVVLCFVVSVAYNVIGLSLALSGRLTPLTTAILMPISSLTVVGLSAGLMRLSARRGLPA